MGKLVVLKLNGDFRSGFQVALEMGEDGKLPDLKMDSALPPNPELADRSRQHWEDTYRHLGNSPRTGHVYRHFDNFDNSYRIKRLKVSYGGHIKRIRECRESAQQIEAGLNQWLKSESFQNIREEWRDFVRKHEEVRVLVQTKDSLIEKLPWHSWDLLKRDYQQAEIALGYSEFKRREPRSPISKNKVRVLAIFGTSEGIDIQTDRQLLEELGDRAEIEIFVEPQRKDINDRLWEQHWDIIFFAGHSETEGNEGRIYLNSDDSLTISELWYGLRKAVDKGLQLVIFNSCDGLGLARSLNDILIPQTIVMRERVPDLVAQEFLRYFLKAFSSGKSLYLSVREARERLQGLENDFPCATWLPVIYQNPAEVPLTWEEYLGIDNRIKSLHHSSLNPVLVVVAIAISLGIGTIAYPFAINPIGIQLNRWGVENIRAKQYDRARFYFKLALRLGANKPRVLNNLGYLYERMGEFDLARENFHQAKLLGDPWGCNNEAFLDIVDGKYQRADELLRTCLGQMQQSQSELGEYLVRKNLGWALLMKSGNWKLGDYSEAEKHLKVAIELISDGGTANCVLAQVLETQNRTSEALKEWQFCFQDVADDRFPESEWKKQAQQRLEAAITVPKN
ncbi:MAG: CHAT domain-containing protein [Geitlerinemataceae cyanobacterium]